MISRKTPGRLLVPFTVLLLLSACGTRSPEKRQENDGPAIRFETTKHDFGQLAFGAEARVYFPFTNVGNEPLVLQTVRSSCNCTAPVWPRDPLEPGSTDSIQVVYNTHIPGYFRKTISVYYNRETAPVRLVIEGTVDEEPAGNTN